MCCTHTKHTKRTQRLSESRNHWQLARCIPSGYLGIAWPRASSWASLFVGLCRDRHVLYCIDIRILAYTVVSRRSSTTTGGAAQYHSRHWRHIWLEESPPTSLFGQWILLILWTVRWNITWTHVTVLQSAVVKETMRISSPAPGRFPRVVPPEGVHHKSSFIPGGVSRLTLFEVQWNRRDILLIN